MKELFKQKLPYFFGVVGVVFIFFGMFIIQDITKLQVSRIWPIYLPSFLVGVCFIVLTVLWHVVPHLPLSLSWAAIARVNRIEHGLQTIIAHARVEVCFGQIQTSAGSVSSALVALPANDLFDDKCIHDTRTALGGFVNHCFTNHVADFSRLVDDKRAALSRGPGKARASAPVRYDIGTTIFFDQPLHTDIRMAFVAVTSVTDNEGIRCEAANIFAAAKGLHRVMNDERLDTLVLPLMGSGHGGLSPSVSLLCMLLAFAECLKATSGHHIKRVRIVVYQKDASTPPAISYWEVHRLLAFVRQRC
ncbi:MAG: DUF6430 domain-containing protein [Planctomycetota bacterium]|nr:DUF6430 domain-containing protein [Planctomycetota bacterium]